MDKPCGTSSAMLVAKSWHSTSALDFFSKRSEHSKKAQCTLELNHPTTFTSHNIHTHLKMAKDRSEKKDKKEKRKSVDGVKKEKKEKRQSSVTSDTVKVEDAAVDADGDVIVDDETTASVVPLGALVPFANPLCDDKAGKKVLKSVKKGTSDFFLLFLSQPSTFP